jgi:aspartyl-tRNA(Asn)/glutamyl-tRNA(Gln) amidotransferase subunit C
MHRFQPTVSELVIPDACYPTSGLYHRAMPVEIDIAKVAKLATLALTDDELATFGEQLGDILEHAERVQALPTEGVLPTSHPLEMVNAFREDVVGECLDPESFLPQAPDVVEGQFRVPRILG